MSEHTPTPPESELFGGTPAPAKVHPPGLLDQLTGVFTEPTALFTKLRTAPSWIQATVLVTLSALVVTIIWVMKVDVDAMIRPALEANPNIPAEQVDKIVEMQGKFMPVIAPIGVIVAMCVATFLPALVFFLLGRKGSEDGAPNYIQALSATAVPNLVIIPQQIVVALMCVLKPVGGASPDKLSPTSLGYFLTVENAKLGALLRHIDPFFIGVYVVTYLALRNLLRLKPGYALAGTLLCAATTLGFRLLGAK